MARDGGPCDGQGVCGRGPGFVTDGYAACGGDSTAKGSGSVQSGVGSTRLCCPAPRPLPLAPRCRRDHPPGESWGPDSQSSTPTPLPMHLPMPIRRHAYAHAHASAQAHCPGPCEYLTRVLPACRTHAVGAAGEEIRLVTNQSIIKEHNNARQPFSNALSQIEMNQ